MKPALPGPLKVEYSPNPTALRHQALHASQLHQTANVARSLKSGCYLPSVVLPGKSSPTPPLHTSSWESLPGSPFKIQPQPLRGGHLSSSPTRPPPLETTLPFLGPSPQGLVQLPCIACLLCTLCGFPHVLLPTTVRGRYQYRTCLTVRKRAQGGTTDEMRTRGPRTGPAVCLHCLSFTHKRRCLEEGTVGFILVTDGDVGVPLLLTGE